MHLFLKRQLSILVQLFLYARRKKVLHIALLLLLVTVLLVFCSGYSQLEFNGTDSSLSVQSFEGDKTGTLHVQHEQTMYAEITDGRSSHMTTLMNIISGENATVAFPSVLSIDQTELIVHGQIDAQTVTVEESSAFTLKETSFTARRTRDGFIPTSDPGEYLFTSLTLKRGSSFTVDSGLTLTGGSFVVKSGVTLQFDFFVITSKAVVVERDAVLDVSGMSQEEHPDAGLSQ